MPSSVVRSFTDPDEYAAATGQRRNYRADVTVAQPGRFQGKLFNIDLHTLWMQHFSQNLRTTSRVEFLTPRAIILFPTHPHPELARDGVGLSFNSIMRSPADHNYSFRASVAAEFGSMSLPIEEMAHLSRTMVGHDLSPPANPLMVMPPLNSIAKLRRLHAAARDLAECAPQVLEHLEAARGLEQALIEAMMHCLDSREVHEDRAAVRQHAAIMRRFHDVIERHLDEPLYIPELSKAVGTSVRTLIACCQEHLGMGPKRFLLLRRMNMVRRALQCAAPGETTVTEVATRYGFWQFGRLAVEYRALFGEGPSTTLARPM